MHSLSFNILIFERILAAVILGSVVGLERELTNKYAGLRTNILVCLGSCVFTILSIYGFPPIYGVGSRLDSARVAAQVLTGIGFIGGGTVLRQGSTVFGLTSAATLWIVAAIGMACGAGLFDVAILSTLLSVIVLVLIRFFERFIATSAKNTRKIKIILTCANDKSDEIHNYIVNNFNYMHEISRKNNDKKDNSTKIIAIIDVHTKKTIQSLYKNFENIKGLESISIQEDNE